MKFQDDFLFAKPVKSGVLKSNDQEVHFLNGTATEHNAFGKMISNENTRQQGWQNAVYELAANQDGSPRYKGKVLKSEFEKYVDRNLCREFGMMILGLSDDDSKSEYEQEVDQELKNSEQESED